jgi:hypothetical protein
MFHQGFFGSFDHSPSLLPLLFSILALHISACIGFAIELVLKTPPYYDNVLYTCQGYFWIFIFYFSYRQRIYKIWTCVVVPSWQHISFLVS